MISALDFSIWLIPTVVWAWVAIHWYIHQLRLGAKPPFFSTTTDLSGTSIIYAINISDPTPTIKKWIHDETTRWISHVFSAPLQSRGNWARKTRASSNELLPLHHMWSIWPVHSKNHLKYSLVLQVLVIPMQRLAKNIQTYKWHKPHPTSLGWQFVQTKRCNIRWKQDSCTETQYRALHS